jgi:hypothetical protein
MRRILDIPLVVFGLSLALWLSAQIGILLQNRFVPLAEDQRQDLAIVIPATLTLLGLHGLQFLFGDESLRSTQELRGG